MVRGLRHQAGLSILEVVVASFILIGALIGIQQALRVSIEQSLKGLNTVKVMIAMDAYAQRRAVVPRKYMSQSSYDNDKTPLTSTISSVLDKESDNAYRSWHRSYLQTYSNNTESKTIYELAVSGIEISSGRERESNDYTSPHTDVNNPYTTRFYLRPTNKSLSTYDNGDDRDWLNQWVIPLTNTQ